MQLDDLIFVPLIGYLGLILCLNYSISKFRIPSMQSFFFILLSFASFGVTWYYMVLYFEWSFISATLRANLRIWDLNFRSWLLSTSLFREAWFEVLNTPLKRFWSEQLCIYCSTMTVLLYSQGARFGNRKSWKYMLLGQIIAISYAQALFFSSLSAKSATTRLKSKNPSILLILSIAVSLFTVALVPFTIKPEFSDYFLPNLLIMHATLILPLLESTNAASTSLSYYSLYVIIAVVAGALRIPTYIELFDSFRLNDPMHSFIKLQKESTVFFGHPAQSSISSDVVALSSIFIIWIILDVFHSKKHTLRGTLVVASAIILTPIFGIGSTAGIYLAYREKRDAVQTLQ